MRGDDIEPVLTGDAGAGTRSGPRHAAPRKSLLTKLHIPVGKAFALAAMPTAVFVGMGLTPRLALADEHHDIPFALGPCVTRSDGPKDPSASGSWSPSSPAGTPKPGVSPSASAGADAGQSDVTRPKPSASPSATGIPSPRTGGTQSRRTPSEPVPPASGEATQGSGETPQSSGTKDPLDPLGLGGLLGGVLGGSGAEAGSPTAGAPTAGSDASEEPAPGSGSTPPVRPTGTASITGSTTHDDTGDTPADAAQGTVRDAARDSLKSAIKDAAKQAGAKVEELGPSAKSLEPGADDDIPAGAQGKPRFPCPTPDPKALADATEAGGIPLLANEPWKLHSTRLTLTGLKYHGIKKVRTYDNALKPVLKFTAEAVDIRDLHQTAQYPGNRTAHVQAAPGSTSTIRQGTVTLYVEELKGNLFGVLPITFSPRTPPPVDISYVFFTDVDVTQAGQFGGTLIIPGLHNYVSG